MLFGALGLRHGLALLERYRIALPPVVREALERGELETPKPGDARLAGHAVHLIATPRQSLEAAAQAARAAGVDAKNPFVRRGWRRRIKSPAP